MSRARDIIQEIADIRQRRQFGSAMAELPLRLFALENAFKSHDRSQTELTRYFPVALVACMEGYFRMAIRELVDSGDPYLANAEKAASTLKPDFSIIRAVHGRRITIGELIAHSIPISRLEHIDSTLTSLLGTKFLKKLEATTDRWAHEVRGEPARPMLTDPGVVFSNVSRTFDLRHVICHEIASAYEIDTAEIEACFESCVAFLRVADECVSETLHPGSPLTQTDMNIAAADGLCDAEARLSAVVAKLTSSPSDEANKAINQVNLKWHDFAEAWVAARVGDRSQGGTMWPMLYAGLKQSLVEKWIVELEEYRDHGKGEI
ncbi:lysozyme inhibitor LprI family protein [Delftia sp. RIT313]|uniref:lysozyme inhibitor LprI family protein n=1 Tax=Delftia sp. RIT313 TaxID=1468410 RepID=UPI00044A1A7E|nr:lysozyme inhibitor LprI family protein [Delftia sp. RIT313]EZP45590.1 hypothetical protein BW39_05949 [Delftia sp. RIT313]